MSTALDLYAAESSNTITVSGVTLDGTLRTDATVQTTVVDVVSGTEVAGVSWPVTLDAVAGEDGTYRATLAADVAFVAGRRYTRTTTIVVGGVTLTLVDRGLGVAVDG